MYGVEHTVVITVNHSDRSARNMPCGQTGIISAVGGGVGRGGEVLRSHCGLREVTVLQLLLPRADTTVLVTSCEIYSVYS